jgi:type III restriction enzyme
VPTKVEVDPLIGLGSIHTLDQLKARRGQEVDFLLAKLVYETYFRIDDAAGEPASKPWLFPQILQAAQAWRRRCLTCKDDCFPQMLLLTGLAHRAADKIYRAIVDSTPGERTLLPILQPYDSVGSTEYVDFDTTRPVWPTRADRCHISHVVCDTDAWEQKMAQTLEDMPEVESYVKNHNLGFFIPYTYEGQSRNYVPDFIVRSRMGAGAPERASEGAGQAALAGAPRGIAAVSAGAPARDPLNFIIEVSGEPKPEKAAKVETARSLWVPAVNNDGRFGRWSFLEISDPWDAKNTIRAHLETKSAGRPAAEGVEVGQAEDAGAATAMEASS